jgi:hypothetical protein
VNFFYNFILIVIKKMNEDVQKGLTAAPAAVIAAGAAANTKIGQRVLKPVSTQLQRISTKVGATTVGKTAGAVGKSVAKAAPALGGVADMVVGSMAIADVSKSDMSGGDKAYQITGEVIGIAANLATMLIAGPAAIFVALAQILGGVLDAFWNPFKGYFNRDIENVRKQINNGIKSEMLQSGLNWPLEVKPDLIGTLGDKDKLELFKRYVKNYYEDNGLIFKEDVLEEENLYKELRSMKRFRKKFTIDEDGNMILNNPLQTALNIQDDLDQNLLLLLALAARNKINKKKRVKPSVVKQYIEANWTSVVISIFVIFLSSIIIVT